MRERRYTVEAHYTGGKSRDWIMGLTAEEVDIALGQIESEKPASVRVHAELTDEEVAQMRSKPEAFGFRPLASIKKPKPTRRSMAKKGAS